jgi:nicotinate-nucleotide adenylyltransferase
MSMLVLATADRPRLFVSMIELESPDRPYTIDTLERFQAELGDVRLFFLMGADSFRDITMWRRHEEILWNFDNIVAGRPGTFSTSNLHEIVAHLAQDLRTKIIDLRGQKQLGKKAECNADGVVPGCSANEIPASPSIYLTDYVSVDVSATNLREAVARDESIEGQVPDAVATYIRKYRLYLNTK